jgi:hypothetical protein
MKQTLTGFLIQILDYGVIALLSIAPLSELYGVFSILGVHFLTGTATCFFAQKKGIKGNLIALLMLMIFFAFYGQRFGSFWIIAMITIPLFHLALVPGWLLGLKLGRTRLEPVGAGQPDNPPVKL